MKKVLLMHSALSLAALSAGAMRSTRFDIREDGPTLKEIGEKVEAGIDELKGEQKSMRDQFTKDLGNLDKTSKGLLEDVTALKKNANDTQAGRDELLKKIKMLDARIQMEIRSHIADPIQRIVADEEKRTRFNCAVRLLMDKDGDMKRLMESQVKALGEDSSPGSTLIDDQLAREIYDTLSTFGVWSSFGVRNVGKLQTKYPLKTARPVANWILTEGGQISDDGNKAGSSVTLTVEVLAVLLNVSLQLLQDSEFDVTRDVMEDFMEALAYRLDYSTVLGDATADATNGGFTGILNAWTAAQAAPGNSTIEGTSYNDWITCMLAPDPIVRTRGARWWLHPNNLVRALGVKDNNGRPIFLTALEAPAEGGIGSLLGYPITLGYVFPTTNATGAKVAAFGDPQSHVVGIRRAFEFDSSDHHKWDTLQRSFRAYGRGGIKTRAATGGAYLRLG